MSNNLVTISPHDLPPKLRAAAIRAMQAEQQTNWPTTYRNRSTGRYYVPHHDDEARFVYSDRPKYALLKGGEGSGKSTGGIIKNLERLRRGMSGIMASPDFEHFRKSLWREFRDWCPWHCVLASYRYMGEPGWQPSEQFILPFITGAELICGGIKEDRVMSWEGPNVHFAHFDEPQAHKGPGALKVLAGRARLAGPNNEPPQVYLTSIPRKNWMFTYFGPIEANDPFASFKRRSLVVTLKTADNASNLAQGHEEDRRASLTESEARRRMDAEWEDEQDSEAFLESMILWDACRVDLPPLRRNEPMVLAMDAGISSDTFSIVGVTGMPGQRGKLAVRYVQQWIPQNGIKLDFDPIEEQIELICKQFAVTKLVYDPYQLHQMGTRLMTKGVVFTEAFNQGPRREQADKGLLDLILARRLLHDGNEALKQAAQNADRKVTGDSVEDKKLRIVKRSPSLKVDPLVALSMACDEALKLGLDQ